MARGVDVAGHAVEPPPVAGPRRRHLHGGTMGRPVPAQAPGAGRIASRDSRQVLLALHLAPEAGDGVGHDVARHERPGVELAPQLLAQYDEVHQGLVGDAAALVLGGDEHGGPAELRSLAPDVGVEGVGLLHGPPHLGERLVLGEEAARRRAQQLLVFAEPEIHGLAVPSGARHTLRSAAAQYSSRKWRL